MNALCKHQLEQLKQHFRGKVYVLQDNGDSLICLIDPADAVTLTGREPPDRGEEWMRVSEPTLMLIDPTRTSFPRVVN